jgi:hypothetical protein
MAMRAARIGGGVHRCVSCAGFPQGLTLYGRAHRPVNGLPA